MTQGLVWLELPPTATPGRQLPIASLAFTRSTPGSSSDAMFHDSSIPHIDSDEELNQQHEESSLLPGNVCKLAPAKRLVDIPESHLMAGISLPGLHDSLGKAVLLLDLGGVTRLGLTPVECARVLLYYTQIPLRFDRVEQGVCLVVLVSGDNLQFLDKILDYIPERISRLVLYSPEDLPTFNLTTLTPPKQVEVARNLKELEDLLGAEGVPGILGGVNEALDQLAWIEFMQEAECLMRECEEVGKRVVAGAGEAEGRSGERGAARSALREMSRLRRIVPESLEHLAARGQPILTSEDVRLYIKRTETLYCELDEAAKHLEELLERRKEKLKDVARIKALESESEQVLNWLSHRGEEWLRRHSELPSTLPALKEHEQDFERFYFISMRQLEKGGDLVEECGGGGGSGLRELARSLRGQMRGFSTRLEDTRERLEDTSRCLYLLDRCFDWSVEAGRRVRVGTPGGSSDDQRCKQVRQFLMARPPPPHTHFTEMLSLAAKLDNDKLLQQCKVAQRRCEETLEEVRGVVGTPDSHTMPRWSSPPGEMEPCLYAPWHYAALPYDDDIASDASKSCEDVDEQTLNDSCCDRGKVVSPVPVNSHLHTEVTSLAGHIDPHAGLHTLKTKKTLLLIMREMIQTERDYVRSLEYVIENYMPELVREDIPQALRGQRNVIFGNIEKIYEFHSQYFLAELERCEQSPLAVGQCFLRHENKFYLYALYNKNKPKSDSLMEEYGSAFFRGKQLELGDKMDLASYLLKPVQRMGKYALLLQQLMKACRAEGAEALSQAETMVRFQLRHGNDLLAMDSLRECDVNVKEQGRLLRQNEFLVWQGKGGKKYYRHVFLFEELILFSKARRLPDRKNLDLYIYKQSIKTSDIGLTAKVGDSNTKFEIWFRKRKPSDTFTLQSISEEVKQSWTDELSNLLWKQALRNRELRLAEMTSMGIGNKPCLDIRPSANQISDRSISIAQLTKTAPRFRNSIAVTPVEQVRKRPHSIISVSSGSNSSSSSSSSSSSRSSGSRGDPATQCSASSSTESGIVSDWNTSESVSSRDETSHVSVKL